MGSTPPLRMLKGLSSAPMEASPDHCSAARNFVNRNGKLSVRPGMKFFDSVGKITTDPAPRFGVTTDDTDPVSVSASISGLYSRWLYVGFTYRPYQFFMPYLSTYGWPDQNKYTTYVRTPEELQYQVWNGSAWVDVGVGNTFQATRDSPTPFMPKLTVISDPMDGTLSGLIDPLATWETKSIAGDTRYWMRVLTVMNGDSAQYPFEIIGTLTYTATENRVKCLLRFRDRAGSAHTFVAYQYGDDDVEMRYELDGENLSIGDSLQPDGVAKVFSSAQIVTAHYHRSTDRVIGCIDGFNWFYLVPSEGAIYALIPDDQALDTPYHGLIDGLRSALPTGACTAIYDDRLWVARGSTVYYSAPGVYADVWSNGFELNLGDGGGVVTGFVVVGGVLAALKRNSIYIIQAAGDADQYTATQIPGNIGCVSPRGAYASDNVAWFPAEDGVYTFNGAELSKVTNPIDEFWGKDISRRAINDSIGIVSTENEEYRLFYPGIGAAPQACDSALYISYREPDEASWPQGPDADGYGFQATAVCVDQTRRHERVLVGDRFGVIWELDSGRYDGPQRVTGEITTSRVNVGTGAKATLRWVTPTVDSETNNDFTCQAYSDDRFSDAVSVTFNAAGDNPSSYFADASTKANDTDTVPYSFDVQTLASGSYECRGRFFRLLFSASAPFTMNAVELGFNMSGRRG